MRKGSVVIAAVAMLACGVAQAQVAADGDLRGPRYFDGLYAGVSIAGLFSSPPVWTTGNEVALGAGGYAGYTHYLTDDLWVAGEVQAAAGYDFVGNVRYDILAMGRIGLHTGDYYSAYATGGAGMFQGTPVFAAGAGVQWGVTSDLSARFEIIEIGQLGPTPAGVTAPGLRGGVVNLGLNWQLDGDRSGSQINAFGPPASFTDFTGFYSAAYYGAIVNFPYNFFPNTGFGWHLTRLTYGGAAGWNFSIAENVLAGIELQGGLLANNSGNVSFDALLLGRIGVVPIDGLFVYGQGGVGVVHGVPAYALGAGAEYAIWGDASWRADVTALGELSSTPIVPGFSAFKLTTGPVWHF